MNTKNLSLKQNYIIFHVLCAHIMNIGGEWHKLIKLLNLLDWNLSNKQFIHPCHMIPVVSHSTLQVRDLWDTEKRSCSIDCHNKIITCESTLIWILIADFDKFDLSKCPSTRYTMIKKPCPLQWTNLNIYGHSIHQHDYRCAWHLRNLGWPDSSNCGCSL